MGQRIEEQADFEKIYKNGKQTLTLIDSHSQTTDFLIHTRYSLSMGG